MNSKEQVSKFIKKYHLRDINSTVLQDTLAKQGYTVIEFNNIENTPDVASLIEALDLRGRVACSKCFTYQNENYRLIFIHEDLNEDERCIVLAHEEGHIWGRHFSEKRIFGNDIIEEFEANEFVHHLLAERKPLRQRNQLVIAICIGLCIITARIGTALYLLKIKQLHRMSMIKRNR